MKVYKFRKYEKIFPILYSNEKKRISKAVHENSLIEHVGSTAVPGLHGKGIIDIMISCPKNSISKIKGNLIKKGYREGKSSDKGRVFLKRDARIKGKARRFHIHIVPLNHKLHSKAICFRNYLIKNPKASEEYSELKRKAIMKCGDDGEVYRKLKTKFIKRCIKKASNN